MEDHTSMGHTNSDEMMKMNWRAGVLSSRRSEFDFEIFKVNIWTF
jgi:hypothetical protein